MAATIIESGTISAMTAIYGDNSTIRTFAVGGTEITTGITVTPPAGFEVSLTNVLFSATVDVLGSGTVALENVYIRLKNNINAANYSGNVVLTSTGATNVNVAVPVSAVTKAILTITADNKTKVAGAVNPTLTYTPTGFKNGDTSTVITTQPTLTTTALTNSPTGNYVIVASSAAVTVPNYNFTYVTGVLSITVPTVEQLIAMNVTDQFSNLKNSGVLKQKFDQGYSTKGYLYLYQGVFFFASTLYGDATAVLVDTTAV